MTAVLVIAFLSLDVVRKIDQQKTASTDNVQWQVAQITVEYLQLLLTVEAAIDGKAPLDDVRLRFDVFYSRMTTMKSGPVFAVVRKDAEFSASYDAVWAFLDRSVPIIDGSDADLQKALPALLADVSNLRLKAAALSMTGIRVFANRTDSEREGIARTLLQVSVLTLGLIVAMGVLAAGLARMNTAMKRQVHKNIVQGARVKAVFATSLDGIIVVDAVGRVLEYNAAAEAMFGYTPAEVLGKDVAPLIVPPHLRDAHSKGLLNYRSSTLNKVVRAGYVRMEAMRKNGMIFPVELSVSVSQGVEGRIFISYLRDVSAQVAAEQELYRARDDALAGEKAKAELLAVMSHEMRTPLNGMLGTMELLKSTKLTNKQQQYHRIMETSGRLLLHHVNDVLDIVRVDSGKAVVKNRQVNLATLIQDIIEGQMPVADAGFNVLRSVLPADGRTVIECDPVRLRQILLNLVGNALKFTRNGEVCIEVERLDDASLVEFRVTDTGIGIREEDRERIFEDFVTLDATYSRSSSGTGLGLGIVRRWVQALGGEVGVESEPGEGSLFWVRLPLTRPAELPQIEATPAISPALVPTQEPSQKRLSVLVVEDNAINRLVVREMLESDGHSVVEAHDGEEGVKLAAVRRWDVILMDVSMPLMDGVEATTVIRQSNGASAQVPIVALTAHALPSETKRFLAAGMQEIMTKPVSRDALRQVLRQVTGVTVALAPKAVATATAVVPMVDVERLAELTTSLGKDRTKGFLKAFVSETDPLIASWNRINLLADRDSGRIEELERVVHRIAGSAAILGASQLRARLAEVETACKSGNPEKAAAGLQQAVVIWPETRSALLAV